MKGRHSDDDINNLINKTGQYQRQVYNKNRRHDDKPIRNISQKQFSQMQQTQSTQSKGII